jgi:hypothetical protein
MLKYLEELELEEDLKRRLKERYLEVLVVDKNIEEERFHTSLAYSYIDTIFKIMPKNTELSSLNLQKDPLI